MKRDVLLQHTAPVGDLAELVLAQHDLLVARRRWLAAQAPWRGRPDLAKPIVRRIPDCFRN